MLFFAGLVLVSICLVSGEEKRQEDQRATRLALFGARANCVDTWHMNNNPCLNNPTGKTYMPHPSDSTKFLQCAQLGRMFVIQCPNGEVFNQATSNCVKQQTILPPITTGTSNPCTAQNIATGRIYFAVANAPSKFIECDLNGNANVLSCPQQLIWDESKLSCVLTLTTGTGNTGLITGTGLTGTGVTGNPCTAQAIATKKLFYSHPDATKFIQCDLEGNAFVQQCPSGLVWNQYQETCASPYAPQVAGIGGVIITQPSGVIG